MSGIHPGWLRVPKPPKPKPTGPPRMGLTEHQIAMLRLRAHGLGNQEIADKLRVAQRTVEYQLQAAYRTLGIRCQYPAPAACYLLGRHDERTGR